MAPYFLTPLFVGLSVLMLQLQVLLWLDIKPVSASDQFCHKWEHVACSDHHQQCCTFLGYIPQTTYLRLYFSYNGAAIDYELDYVKLVYWDNNRKEPGDFKKDLSRELRDTWSLTVEYGSGEAEKSNKLMGVCINQKWDGDWASPLDVQIDIKYWQKF